jgi:hypothetical protein
VVKLLIAFDFAVDFLHQLNSAKMPSLYNHVAGQSVDRIAALSDGTFEGDTRSY